MADLIDRQAAIDDIARWSGYLDEDMILRMQTSVKKLPSAQPTLYGYSIEHLVFISKLLAKENLPPERVSEALSDIGRIIAIVRKESEEAMKKAVEQCMI